ncbi:hypothetical protein [Pseudochelatococcus sp. G4_1912]|uniref:hypothetical protein n=1 Tax=Pseudochelatococcus sp. G4_1912 TaxID=3114288 RepID=UPI0039C703F6
MAETVVDAFADRAADLTQTASADPAADHLAAAAIVDLYLAIAAVADFAVHALPKSRLQRQLSTQEV